MCLFEREKTILFSQGGPYDQYRRCVLFCIIVTRFPLIVTKQASEEALKVEKGRGCLRSFTGVILKGKSEVKLTMEVDWIADRATLRSLAREHPEWTQQDLTDPFSVKLGE